MGLNLLRQCRIQRAIIIGESTLVISKFHFFRQEYPPLIPPLMGWIFSMSLKFSSLKWFHILRGLNHDANAKANQGDKFKAREWWVNEPITSYINPSWLGLHIWDRRDGGVISQQKVILCRWTPCTDDRDLYLHKCENSWSSISASSLLNFHRVGNIIVGFHSNGCSDGFDICINSWYSSIWDISTCIRFGEIFQVPSFFFCARDFTPLPFHLALIIFAGWLSPLPLVTYVDMAQQLIFIIDGFLPREILISNWNGACICATLSIVFWMTSCSWCILECTSKTTN